MLNINISKNIYPEVKRAKEIGQNWCYTFANGGRTGKNIGMKTYNIKTCTAFELNAEKHNNELYHLAPEQQAIHRIKEEVEKRVFRLQDTFGEVKAFLYGGVELNNKNPESVASFNLYNTLADVLDNLGIPFAMICGKKQANQLDNMYVINNNITIWNDLFKKFIKPKEAPNQEQIMDILKEHYQFVESTDEHALKFLEALSAKPQAMLSKI